MNINYNTSLVGEYTLYDEGMNVLCETKNLITDWGMRRFVGDRSTGAPQPADGDDSQLAFVNNMRHIMVGTGSTEASATDWRLESMIPLSSFFITNEAGTTGTSLSTDENGDLIMRFTRLTRFKAASAFPVGITSYSIREIGCSWSTTVAANNRYGIFSRAVLPTTVIIKPRNAIFAKYELTIKTSCNKMLSSMPYYKGTGANDLPLNKTNVRRLPLYRLTSSGNPSATLNQGIAAGVFDASEHVQPLFEDNGLWNTTYVGSGYTRSTYDNGWAPFQDNAYGTSVGSINAYKIWWLQMYNSGWATGANSINGGANPTTRYDMFVSTTSISSNNSASLAYSDRIGQSLVYDQTVAANLVSLLPGNANNSFTGRKHADSVDLVQIDSNTWQRKITFLFSPTEFEQNTTVLKLYPATLGDWDGSGSNSGWNSGYKYIDSTATHDYGIVTVFNEPLAPPTNLFNGFQYTFTFIRN